MKLNVYLREYDQERGTLIGTADPTDDFGALVAAVEEYGVGGEVYEVGGQFVADSRGGGFEVAYTLKED